MKEEFLDHLAATCNINAAAELIGVERMSVYHLRRKDEAFRASWAVALECGYEALETQLVGHALGGGGPLVTNGTVDPEGVHVRLALALLTQFRNNAAGRHRRAGPPLKRVTAEQTDASILRKLKAMGRLPVPSR